MSNLRSAQHPCCKKNINFDTFYLKKRHLAQKLLSLNNLLNRRNHSTEFKISQYKQINHNNSIHQKHSFGEISGGKKWIK